MDFHSISTHSLLQHSLLQYAFKHWLLSWFVRIPYRCLTIQESSSITLANALVFAFNFLFFFGSMFVVSSVSTFGVLQVYQFVLASAQYWFSILLLICVSLVPFVVEKFIRYNYAPYLYQVSQKVSQLEKEQRDHSHSRSKIIVL